MPYLVKHPNDAINRTIETLKGSYYEVIGALQLKAWISKEPVSFDKRYKGVEKQLSIGDSWGELWDCGWFHVTGSVPKAGKDLKIALMIDINGEATIYDHDICPVRGLTNVNSSFDISLGKPGKRVWHYIDEAKGDEVIDFWMETGCNDLFGRYSKEGTVEQSAIAICHEETRQLYYDFEVLRDLMEALDENSARRASIFNSLVKASNGLKVINDETVAEARGVLRKELSKKGGDASLNINAIGHAHIDLAWLWPIRETKRKGARTFSTVLDLMDKYPDYIFGASQPQLFQWMKEDYPKLYKRLKEKVLEGRIEVQGGMWVEADTNIPSGESLVRQFLYGKRFFKEEFDEDMKMLWLPDVFGYTASLPQIMRKSGIEYFMTIKLSWNEMNQFPHHTFNWEGIDGSKVLSHMPPEGTYNSSASPKAIKNIEKKFLDKGISDACLMLYGIGDGGGGPGMEHLERLNRIKDLNGLVPVKQGKAIDFFERINQNVNDYKSYRGELYLEKHHGTYTSQGKSKWFNRKMELLLRDVEILSSMAMVSCGVDYEAHKLEEIWKEVLLYQFHDILPGTSIKRVYVESLARYELLHNELEQLKDKLMKVIAGISENKTLTDSEKARGIVVANTSGWTRKEYVCVNGEDYFLQIEAMSVKQFSLEDLVEGDIDIPVESVIQLSESSFENDCLKVCYDHQGLITDIYDKINACPVVEGNCNNLTLYFDDGDAWDFHRDYMNRIDKRLIPKSYEIASDKNQVRMIVHYKFNDSGLKQIITLKAHSSRLDFESKVWWNETNRMLRTDFPVAVTADQVKCDIQYGHVLRNNHNNTHWDLARGEICAHKWIDLSTRNYGVALLNDSKYGHRVDGHVMDINLLRAANYPGEKLDEGYHEFTYALFAHKGESDHEALVREAHELNSPLCIAPVSLLANTDNIQKILAPFIVIDEKNIVIDCIKKAEDSNGIIIRMYEAVGQKTKANLITGIEYTKVKETNLMEEIIGDLSLTEPLVFEKFEVKTVLLS